MTCQVCGNALVPGSGFCGSCGAPVTAPTAGDAPTAVAPSPPGVPPGAPPEGSYTPGWSAAPAPAPSSKKGLLWGLVALVVVAVGGIGAFLVLGGDDDEPASPAASTTTSSEAPPESTSTTTTEAEELLALADWAEEADDICREAEEEIGALGPPEDEEELVELLGEVIDLAGGLHDDIVALGLPDEEADAAEDLLALFADRIELLEDILAGAEEGDLDEWEAFAEDGYPDEDEAAELADDLGLEVCGINDEDDPPPPTTGTPPPTAGSDPFTYGDDPALDALWDACDAGDPAACDELWTASTHGTEYYDFGFSCGYRVPEGEVEICSDVMGGQGDPIDPYTFGDDAYLDSLWTACSAGDPVACDDLWAESPIDSIYEEFGYSCGYRVPEGEVRICSEIM